MMNQQLGEHQHSCQCHILRDLPWEMEVFLVDQGPNLRREGGVELCIESTKGFLG